MVIRIQPDEGVTLVMNSKIPGLETRTQPVKMHFRYATTYGSNTPEAYERLILDAMVGDSTLFIRGDETEASWKLVTPILEFWEKMGAHGLAEYAAGSWGPLESERLLVGEGAPVAPLRLICKYLLELIMSELIDALPGIELPVSDVTQQLATMWDTGPQSGLTEARASQMNVVLHLGTRVQPAQALKRFEELIEFSHRYPCRIIVLCPKQNELDGSMQAKLFSQCYIGASSARDVL